MTGVVFNIMRFAVNDGPGIRTTVFLKGCPLRCQWCHNPESQHPGPELILRQDRCVRCGACVDACEHGAIGRDGETVVIIRDACTRCGRCVEVCWPGALEPVGQTMTAEEVLREICRDTTFYDESRGGATFSGGEPLVQHDFLLALLRGCRDRGIHTAVDTSGYAAPAVVDVVARCADLFLYDLKLVDEDRHRRFTGVSNRPILDNLRRLVGTGARVVVRFPLIPGVNDHEENVRQIGAFVRSLGGIEEIDVLPYHDTAIAKYDRLGRAYRLRGVARPTQARVADVAVMLRGYVGTVSIGG